MGCTIERSFQIMKFAAKKKFDKLKEAELELEERYDDQYGADENCYWRSEFWGKLMLSAVRVCRLKKDETLKEDIRKSVYRVLNYQDNDGYLCTYLDKDLIVAENKDFFNWNVWGRKYILWALVESAMLLDDDHVLDCAVKLLDHLIKQIEEQKTVSGKPGIILTEYAPEFQTVAGCFIDSVQHTEGADHILFGDQTGNGRHRRLPVPPAQR